MQNDLHIKYQGFHPSYFTSSYLESVLDEIHSEAPAGSVLFANFIRDHHQMKARVSINSSAGNFFATANGRRLKDVTRKLTEQIKRQLDRWKERRFEVDNQSE